MSVKPTYEELERFGRQADITIENLEQKLADSQREFRAADATIENMQMQVEKLAAENAGLKGATIFLADEASQVYKRWNLIQQPDGDLVDMQTIHEAVCTCHETPETDAFLAEVRAQGVDAAIGTAKNLVAQEF